jgi:hypothetical protein
VSASDTARGPAAGSGWSVEAQPGASSRSSSSRDSRSGSRRFAARADLRVKVAETEDTWFTESAKR